MKQKIQWSGFKIRPFSGSHETKKMREIMNFKPGSLNLVLDHFILNPVFVQLIVAGKTNN
jgi:hypothetical protein